VRRYDFDEIAGRISRDGLGQALGLERKGSKWRCPHPDHEDRNPSFSIFRTTDGRTHAVCHRCGTTHTPVQLAAAVWGTSLPEAAERLARIIGL
jgi:hypothetical protein